MSNTNLNSLENQIAYINEGEIRTSTDAIAEGVELQHKNVIALVRKFLVDLQEFGPIAFETRMGSPLPQGGYSRSTEVAILNEDQATLLITYMKNTEIVRNFKKRLVKAFSDLKNGKQFQLPQNFAEALQLAADQAQQIEEAKPKLIAFNRIAESEGSETITRAAKTLQVKPNYLFKWLDANSWIYRRVGNKEWTGYQTKIDQGLLEHKVSTYFKDGEECVSTQVRITPKGITKLSEKLGEAA